MINAIMDLLKSPLVLMLIAGLLMKKAARR